MYKRNTIKHILTSNQLFLVYSFFIAILFYILYKSYFETTNENLIVIAILTFIFSFSIFIFSKNQKKLFANLQGDSYSVLLLILSCFVVLLLYYYSTVAILLSMPSLYADEWNIVHRLLFSEDIVKSIFKRYNQHPNYLLNIIYAINIYFLKCKESWFIGLNILAILGNSFWYFKVASTYNSNNPWQKYTLSLSIALFAFWITAAGNVFWNLAYIPIFGTITSIYGLASLNKSSVKKPISLFFFGALITSTSFGFGAILWALLPIPVILRKFSIKYILFSMIVGILGLLQTMGYYSIEQKNLELPEISTFAQSIPIFLGRTITIFNSEHVNTESFPLHEFIIGSIGLIVVCTFLIIHIIKYRNKINSIGTFGFLLVCFTIAASIIIVLGRMQNNDLSIMLSGRYTNWSTLFWVGLLFLTFSLLSNNGNRMISKSITISFSFISIAFITIFNGSLIIDRLITYNIAIRGKVDLVVNANGEGNEKLIFAPESLRKNMLKANSMLKEKEWSIYSDRNVSMINSIIPESMIIPDLTINQQVPVVPDNKGNYYIESYIQNPKNESIKSLIITNNRKVVGIGLPYSDYLRYNDLERNVLRSIKYNSFPYRFFPGTSNYFFAQFSIPNPTELNKVELFGYTSKGRLIIVSL